jgi:hypothetical protein
MPRSFVAYAIALLTIVPSICATPQDSADFIVGFLWQIHPATNNKPMQNAAINPGDLVLATTAFGENVRMRAVRHPEAGRDFPVIWLATEDDFEEGGADSARAIPWPLEAVAPLQHS